MKANRLRWLPVFLVLSTVFQLAAQQIEVDHKRLADLRARAEAGDAQSQCFLGDCYYHALGVAKDEVEAVRWYRKAADQNYAVAQCNLGVCYANGQGVAKDEVESAKWHRRAADQNYVMSQWYLGSCYANGQGVVKDDAVAVRWYRKAAEQNYAGAQLSLGSCYANGQGVAQDDVEAVKWYHKAAEQNLALAQLSLGLCYTQGQGVAKDEAEAAKWYRKAAEQNNIDIAQYAVGVCYTFGQGVPQDNAEAVKWYRKAAEQNLPQAQCSLGLGYAMGLGVAKDYEKAVEWYRKAAEQNFVDAQVNLGLCYALGQGVVKDYVEAYKWILLASAKSNENAKQEMTLLEEKMTREQIAEGQTLARNFKPREVPQSGGNASGPGIAQTRPESSGTGFFITEDGYLITNEHVAGAGAQVRLVTSAGLISARVVKVDAANDLALLKADGKFVPLPVAASRSVRMGSTVATVGFPNIGLQGFASKLAKGEIAALSGAQDDPKYFQISVPVQPGNSGGALVDERGNVVGVVAGKLSVAAAVATSGSLPENVNYAVKSSFLLGFLESVPDVAGKLKEPSTNECRFEDVVKSAENAAVLVLVY